MPIHRLYYVGSMQTPEDCAFNPWGSEAHNVTQLSLMRAFRACGVTNIIGLSFPGSSAWHNTPRLKAPKRSTLDAGLEIQELPFLAFGPLQPFTQAISCILRLLRTARAVRPGAIVVTNPLVRLSLPAIVAGALWRVPVLIMVADLTPTNATRNPISYMRHVLQQETVRIAPGVVVFSSHVGRELRPNRPWIRMVRPPAPKLLAMSVLPLNPETRIIYFAGTTAEVTGADLFLEAIHHIQDSTYRFWFSGRGPLDRAIYKAAQQDKRITHWGFVKRERYRELLQQANVLVNPRPTRLPENRYNFPSKLMEYMAAGRPIISTATSDVAEHYLEEIVLLEDETPEGLAKLICEVCNWPLERQLALGQRARARVQNETWEAQAQKILGFIEALVL